MTGTSTKPPITVASAAPAPGPDSASRTTAQFAQRRDQAGAARPSSTPVALHSTRSQALIRLGPATVATNLRVALSKLGLSEPSWKDVEEALRQYRIFSDEELVGFRNEWSGR